MSQSVVICGYYGFENLGDEVILSVLLQRVRAQDPDATITVLAGDVAAVRRDHRVAAVHWRDIDAIRDAVFGADHVIVGGGGLVEDIYSTPRNTLNTVAHAGLTYYAGIALLAQVAGVATTIESVGVGPLASEDGRELAAVVLSGASAVRVRDHASLRLVEAVAPEAEAELVLDPAWELTPAPRGVGERILRDEGITERLGLTSQLRPLAVCLRPWEGFSPDSLVEALMVVGGRKGRPLVFVPFSRGRRVSESDLQIALSVATRLPNAAVLASRYSGPEVASVLGACEITIAMRLHASILSLRAGTPALGLAYHPKVSHLHGVSSGYESLPLASSASDIAAAVDSLLGSTPVGAFQTAQWPRPLPEIAGADPAKGAGSRLLLSAMQERIAETAEEFTTANHVSKQATDEQRRIAALLRTELENERKQRRMSEARLHRLESGRGVRVLRTLWRLRRRSQSVLGRVRSRLVRPSGPIAVTSDSRSDRYGDAQSEKAGDDGRGPLHEPSVEALRKRIGPGANIFAFAPCIPWDAVLFQRPQQLALAVGRLGFPTIYCVEAEWHSVRTVAPNVHVLAGPDSGHAVLSALEPFAVLTLPYNYLWSRDLGETVRLLDHIDELEVFQSFPRDELAAAFDIALAEADVVSCTAQALVEQVDVRRPDAILCPNGVSVVHFAPDPARTTPDDFPEHVENRIVVGFFGAMARWMDWDLVDDVAGRMEDDATFVFIGPDYDKTMHNPPGIWDRPNVHWLGPQDHSDLPAYLDRFDVSIVPFQLNNVTHAVSPLKLFEYLAGECPVVATPIREALQYPEVRTAGTASEFVEAIRAAAQDGADPSTRASLRRRALANSWDVRAVSLVEQALRARVATSAE